MAPRCTSALPLWTFETSSRAAHLVVAGVAGLALESSRPSRSARLGAGLASGGLHSARIGVRRRQVRLTGLESPVNHQGPQSSGRGWQAQAIAPERLPEQ